MLLEETSCLVLESCVLGASLEPYFQAYESLRERFTPCDPLRWTNQTLMSAQGAADQRDTRLLVDAERTHICGKAVRPLEDSPVSPGK